MARSIESVHQFEHSQPYGLPKDKTVIRCHDGAVYEFERAEGRNSARLVRGFQPDGSMSHVGSSSRLPAAVEETVSMLLTGWSE